MKQILHIYADYGSPDARRFEVARESWRKAYSYQFQGLPICAEELPRLVCDAGKRTLFYAIDMIAFGIGYEPDYIVLTNSDVGLMCGAERRIRSMAAKGIPFWSNRMDYDGPIDSPPILNGETFIGTDLFAFPFNYAVSIVDSMPDMLVGAEAWDAVLRDILKTQCSGHEEPNLIFHERHPALWLQPQNINKLPSQRHNLTLAHEYFKGRLEKPTLTEL